MSARMGSFVRSANGHAAGAALLYLAYALVVTWPVVLHLGSSIYGIVPGDLAGSIAHAREVVQQNAFPFAPVTLNDFNAPWGVEEQWVINLVTLPSAGLFYALCYAFGVTAGHTLFVLIGYVLSGLAMFLLARRVTGSGGAALVAGFAFAFYPYAIVKGAEHPHFVHGWVLVLPLWRMLELAERPSLRNGLLAGAATVLAMWFTPYFILIGFVVFATASVVVLARAWIVGRAREPLPGLAAAMACVVVFVAGAFALQMVAGGDGAGGERTHPLSTLTVFSARLHEFVVPDRRNLLFDTEAYLTARLHGSNFSENSLYLGISVLLLALAGAVLLVRQLRRSGRAALLTTRASAGLAAAALAVSGLAFSAPPQVTVAGELVPAPAWFVYQVTSTWRVYSRFVTVVMLGVVLLAAIAVAALLRRYGPRPAAAIAAALLAVVTVDLWARDPGRVTTPVAPAIYDVVKRLPPGTLAEYPVQPAIVPNATAVFYQQAHGKPILNGYADGSEDESRKLELMDLGDRETPGELAALGVRYVLVRSDYAGGPPGRGLELLHRDEVGGLYRVTARPATSGVDALSNFWIPEGSADGAFRWLIAPEGRVLVWADCQRCEGRLTFQSSSAGHARELRVLDPRGRELHRQTIAAAPNVVHVPLSFSRGIELTFRISPDPEPVAGDARPLGITLFEPRFETARPSP